MHHEEHGTGDPLVLLHGGIGSSEMFAGLIPELAKHRRAIAVDLLGYSLGAAVALRTAIQHPGFVRNLILVSTPFSRAGNFPEVLAAMDAMSEDAAEPMRQSPAYAHYEKVAPRNEWRTLVAKTAELLKVDYDWGGGLRDAGWDGSAQPGNRLAVLPGRSHYDILHSPLLAPAILDFL